VGKCARRGRHKHGDNREDDSKEDDSDEDEEAEKEHEEGGNTSSRTCGECTRGSESYNAGRGQKSGNCMRNTK